MIAKRLLGLAAASAALLGWAGHALADPNTFNITLNGALADYSTGASFVSGTTLVDPSFLPLTGLEGGLGPVNQGDIFNITVLLDGSLTIPASGFRTDVILDLRGTDFPNINTGLENEVVDFTNQGNEVISFGGESTTTSGELAVFNPIFPPNNGPLTFDKITYSFDVQTLGEPATLNGADLSFSLLSNAVPEPQSWMLMVVGFGGLGATLRSLRKRAFA